MKKGKREAFVSCSLKVGGILINYLNVAVKYAYSPTVGIWKVNTLISITIHTIQYNTRVIKSLHIGFNTYII